MDEELKARKIFAENLQYFAQKKGKTQADITAYMKCSASTTSDWFNGRKYPRVDKMQRLADYLGVLISDLTKEHASDATSAWEKDPLADQLFAAYNGGKEVFDQDDIDDIKMFMEMVAQRKRRKQGKE